MSATCARGKAPDGSDIPDLEFLTPYCSVCYKPTRVDDSEFICEHCNIWWPSSGYGHEAQCEASVQ